MALPANFSLLHSELNDFLFAQLSEEENGSSLSVLSAMTRLGADPWAEGARLSELPREEAARAVMALIVLFPNEKRGASEVLALAERLAGLLPRRPGIATNGMLPDGCARPAMPSITAHWRCRLARVAADLRRTPWMSIVTWAALAACAAVFAARLMT